MNQPAGWYPDPGDPSLVRYWDGTGWSPRTAPKFSTPPPPPRRPQPTEKQAKNSKLIMAGLAVLGVVGLVVAVAVGGANSDEDGSTTVAAPSTTSARATATSTTRSAAQIQASEQAAAAAASRAAAAAAAEAERKNPAAYEQLNTRDFALIARDSAAAQGRKIVLYGYVSQFDSATGTNQFRASVDSQPLGSWYEYDHNVVIKASDRGLVANVVEDDLITMWVEVDEPLTYDTTLGGSTTVPSFRLNMIQVAGSK
ncbi:hypothetical protein D092_20675 [Rhodococcus ruber Chol-4]|uniref:DUF2510 domain-containing protein n=1 Tax=Rhodococcus TaxID=1827 RepID=UPI0003647B9A|nr:MULTISPECIES: DUF2510 domain-containing protein [Rhodococcus]MDO2381020.1 DUF2510 domain-containing protein [Rhodococcus ruber]KXF84340.1 hypothetical protein D092_20675 [Rhodococcus ruber Chol-4]MDO1481827.1 DUF2510 domain-containing protein [Rhodococcus ruber]RQM31778.1 hypothetical protein TN91_24235 [Rhodococcus ruber]WKK14743.1 DUF2510 domain-containing protein [Rhodococcus ruber]